MLNWFTSKKKTAEVPLTMGVVSGFVADYNNSREKGIYAMTMWGIVEAFNKIFGGLSGYHKDSKERQGQYLSMIGANALKELRGGNVISASCNQFFVNYLAATKGLGRSQLRGEIEQVADFLDGVVRHGAEEIMRVGEMETQARVFLSGEAIFQIGSTAVRGGVTERAVVELSEGVLRDLQTILKTREDYYWFLIEQHDQLVAHKDEVRTMLDGLLLFPIEYEGRNSQTSYVGKPNPGIAFMAEVRPAVRAWCAATAPTFNPDELSVRVIGAIYGRFRQSHQTALDAIRLEYATHYHNNCIGSGSFRNADRWSEVVNALS
ncbi:MAG: hypothetical protein Q7T70_15905 [Polaromonas sp.]|nr:hypothetical protein [Polaromonas sp.]